MHSHTYRNGFIIVWSQHLLAIEHHIQCLVGHTLCVDSVPLWQPTHHHVRIPYCLHLQEYTVRILIDIRYHHQSVMENT